MTTEVPQIPSATYRLQLFGHLTFAATAELVDYLAELGIGALYLSPFFKACAGSTHGYDVVDQRQPDPTLGTLEEFAALAQRARAAGLGVLVDIVPNHMGIDDPGNQWWQDVLENGPASQYARFFDIDWQPPKEALQEKVLLPVLGDQFGKVLEEQQLSLVYDDQRFVINYYQRHFPTAPRSWATVLRHALDYVAARLEAEEPDRMELESIITSLDHIPPRSETSAEAIQERHREKEVAKRRLALLHESSEVIRSAIERTLVDFNGDKSDPASFMLLEGLLAEQPYRLCYWRVATDEINYRRFFDVDSLAAIRVEDPEVFEAVHASVLEMVKQRWVTGLRIDHADGLLDPERYLANLADATRAALSDDRAASAQRLPLYTVVEKILGADESLPGEWLTHGTTGYDFLNLLGGVFVDRLGGYALRDSYLRFIGRSAFFADVLYDSKRTILSGSLSAELYVLSRELDRISEQHRWSRDFTRFSLFRALREVVACFPVYRTYLQTDCDTVRDEDRKRILTAVRIAKRRNPAMSASFFDFIASVLLLEDPQGLSDEQRQARRHFVLKFQQITGPVTAKGLEDTTFYRYYPLASVNEVGADPAIPGTTVEHFHRRMQEQVATWPHTMLASGTHDTKRGEDLRARLNVLSEMPDRWEACLVRWRALNESCKRELDGEMVPDANEEHLIYQTLVGTWPLETPDEAGRAQYVDRIAQYLDKAFREAKVHTSWLNPNEEFDQATAAFVRGILADWSSHFVRELDAMVRSIANAGFVNSLAQTVAKICSPGVADFYQGVEFWDFNLVDPDNRRPVDFDRRRAALRELSAAAKSDLAALAQQLRSDWASERNKLFVTWRGLMLRRERVELREGRYEPLMLDGPRRGNLLAFARVSNDHWTLCLVPRLASEAWQSGPDVWQGTSAAWWSETLVQLPPEAPAEFRQALTGAKLTTQPGPDSTRTLDVAQVFADYPVAMLTGETS